MDLSLEAIQNDLDRAETALGRPEAAIHSQRALIRATLRAQQPSEPDPTLTPLSISPEAVDINVVQLEHGNVYFVPKAALDEDRLEVAAQIINWDAADFGVALQEFNATPIPGVVKPEDDDTEDVFADAKKAKTKK